MTVTNRKICTTQRLAVHVPIMPELCKDLSKQVHCCCLRDECKLALDQGLHQSKTSTEFGLLTCRLKGVSGTCEMVAPSSAAQTSTSRLKVVGVTKLE